MSDPTPTPTPTPTPPVFTLPLGTNITIFLVALSLSTVVALWITHYYARKGLSMIARVTVISSYICALMSIFVTFLDVTGGYHKELKPIWTAYYALVSIGCWIIVPFQQAYHDNGGFTFSDKAKHSLKDEGLYYGIVISVACAILGYIWLTTPLTLNDVFGLVLAIANTFGFLLLTLFFGSGLMNFPLSIWNRSNREKGLQFCLYKLGKLNEKMQVEQDRLQQTNTYIELLSSEDQCPSEYTDLLDIIRSKLPPPTSYEFAFIGASTGTEAHGELEKLQKLSFSDLKRKQFIALHYIVINHRRSLAMFQSEWKDTSQRYLYLNQLAQLRRQYPKMSDLPPNTFIAPGETTYSNFPGSFMWTLPCCCGEKDDTANETTVFAQEFVNGNTQQGQNLDDLTISMTSSQAKTNPPESMTIQRTASTINTSNYENSTASTMDSNNDIYDDMTSRHTSNLGSLGLKYQTVNSQSGKLGTWLFRKPPHLVPGTMYYRLTWLWYKFVVYLQPWGLRFISLIFASFSAILLWSEISIVISTKLSPMYYLAHANVSPTTLMIFRVLPLTYIVGCIYYTVFNINLGWWFHMQPQHRTSEHSMLFSCSLTLRTIFTTTFNYYQMCGIKDTAFLNFVGPMSIVPILGKSFNYVMPLFVALFALLTLVNCWAAFMKLLGVPHFSFSMRSKESESFINDGRLLIDRHQRRTKGERVDHFRSKEVEGCKLRENREAKKAADGSSYVPKPKRESQAIKAIKEREEREAAERDALARAEQAEEADNGGIPKPKSTAAWNSKPMPNKFNKYHSQAGPKTNLDDF